VAVQPGTGPAQVSLTKNPMEEADVEPRFVAEVSKVTKRPVASTVADRMGALACVTGVPLETETICVEGVQPEATPVHVSRTNACVRPFVPPVTKFVAEDRNAT
jgi:hypothetical protein